MQIKILYFAQLADFAERSEETREIETTSPAELYARLKKEFRFPHAFEQIQVAVNHRLSAHETELKANDEIAFLPPMTGG